MTWRHIGLLIWFSMMGQAMANIIDYSVNQPSFPPGGLALLQTVNAGSTRRSITIQNQSANLVQIWRDQTCTGSGLSLVVISAAGSAGNVGGTWTANDFTGCVRIYGTAGSQLAIYTN